MKRRELIHWMGVSAIASSLPVAIAACTDRNQPTATSDSPLPVPTLPNSEATISTLDQAGLIDISVDGKPTTLIRNPASPNQILAVNTICPHKGCTVKWQSAQKSFVCPCHQAQFSPTGAVTRGPANQPLTQYKVNVNGDQIMVEA